MLHLCCSKVFNAEYFIYINCLLISLNASLHCCTKYNDLSLTACRQGPHQRTPRWRRWCHPSSLPPSSPSSLLAISLSLSSVWTRTQPRRDGGIFSLTERNYIFGRWGKCWFMFLHHDMLNYSFGHPMNVWAEKCSCADTDIWWPF